MSSTSMKEDRFRIFVFGSNLRGRHGKGAALHAVREYGAIEGQAVGHQGMSYAVPTKDAQLRPLPLPIIDNHIGHFLLYAMRNPTFKFNVTQIGCGLAGYKAEQIAPLFNIPYHARTNIWFDKAWAEYLEPGPTNFWEGSL